MIKKFIDWAKSDRYYQVGFVNPKTLQEQYDEGIRISYEYDRKRNMAFSKKVPVQKAIQKYCDRNSWIFDSENRYTKGLNKMECIQIITEENIQIHPLFRKKAKIKKTGGILIARETEVDDGYVYARGYWRKIPK